MPTKPQKKHEDIPYAAKPPRGRPPGGGGKGKSSTERVRSLRAARLKEGGIEISTFLRREPSISLSVLSGALGIRQNNAVVEHVLVAEAKRLAPDRAAVEELVRQQKISPEMAAAWLIILNTDRKD